MKTKYYITFGVGTILGRYYLILEAETEMAARKKIIELMRGNHIWAGIYKEEEFKSQINEFGLMELQVSKVITQITNFEEKQALRG